jgi:hypothetical protein
MKLAIIKILITTKFRQWFDNFVILDPYRDIELTRLIVSLPLVDLLEQFGSAWVQKEIIASMDSLYLNKILKNKNVYNKKLG